MYCRVFSLEQLNFHCTVVLLLSSRLMVPGLGLSPWPGSWVQAHAPGPEAMVLGLRSQAPDDEGPNYILKLPIHLHRAALFVHNYARVICALTFVRYTRHRRLTEFQLPHLVQAHVLVFPEKLSQNMMCHRGRFRTKRL